MSEWGWRVIQALAFVAALPLILVAVAVAALADVTREMDLWPGR